MPRPEPKESFHEGRRNRQKIKMAGGITRRMRYFFLAVFFLVTFLVPHFFPHAIGYHLLAIMFVALSAD